ncbi:CheR family methyltransferase [Lederbergia wuyishanensis]|uniref:protein-glutamate O-methyltransferase n=1 Tax=Lederbergia wuyishanensis TaxID=1347903 RepID=A0ABU0D0Z0_9BACI|nr:protein-glutamate O-methyltransferase CheR [Lederbergia wuyishanensis]MCJ8006674.1 protein-glutamate O-methyltransferase CheR [Lederbergia wuyishanensis]MDQ0342056.1 chemotaxis protein methyltransferase CheR [Lederbergia wuyishanensis]
MDQDYHHFILQIKQKTGIDLSLYKEAQMKRRLTSLYQKKGYSSFKDFYAGILSEPQNMNDFLDKMTINVTEFFRNRARWEVLENKILPRLMSNKKKLKIWSAASSTGEEPYTISMILSKYISMEHISILATDIDEQALAAAKAGIYSERSLAEIPSTMLTKFFKKEGNSYIIDDVIKKTVDFRKLNLLGDAFYKDFDLIICRNVLIYFTEEAKDNLYKKFSKSLADDGVLFVGSTEQIFNPGKYDLEVEDTFFYRKVKS